MKCKRLAFHASVVSAFAVLGQFYLFVTGYSPFENRIFLFYICCSWLAVIFCYLKKDLAAIVIGFFGTILSASIGIPILISGVSIIFEGIGEWSVGDSMSGILSSIPQFFAGAFLSSLFIHFAISGLLALSRYSKRFTADPGR